MELMAWHNILGTSRWTRQEPISYERNFCIICSNEKENEYYVLFEYARYDELMRTLVPQYSRVPL